MGRNFSMALALAALLGIPGCGDGGATTPPTASTDGSTKGNPLSPEETLARMIELARAGDWETYVDDFYGEADKFEGRVDHRDALVAKFRDQWADKIVSGFEPLEGKTAEIVDNGKKALFNVDGSTLFTLYLSDDGRWTFHL